MHLFICSIPPPPFDYCTTFHSDWEILIEICRQIITATLNSTTSLHSCSCAAKKRCFDILSRTICGLAAAITLIGLPCCTRLIVCRTDCTQRRTKRTTDCTKRTICTKWHLWLDTNTNGFLLAKKISVR